MTSRNTEIRKEQIRERLKLNVIRFVEELYGLFPYERDIIAIRLFLQSLSNDRLINNFIEHVLPHKTEITEGNENFFINNTDSIFKPLENTVADSSKKVNYFKTLWLQMDYENKQTCFEYFRTFISLIEKYLCV